MALYCYYSSHRSLWLGAYRSPLSVVQVAAGLQQVLSPHFSPPAQAQQQHEGVPVVAGAMHVTSVGTLKYTSAQVMPLLSLLSVTASLYLR